MTLLADTMVPVDAIMLDKYQVTIQSGKTVNLKVKYYRRMLQTRQLNGLPATQMLQRFRPRVLSRQKQRERQL